MRKIKESQRIQKIERKWNDSIKELFHNWHWKENLTHKEIAEKIGVPRPSVTRWFREFKIISQSCQRMTKRRWQIRLVKVLRQIKKQRFVFDPPCLANKHFFKKWTPEMAYVLGYFAADGCMFINQRGSRYIEFVSTDRRSIQRIRAMMHSKHSIGEREFDNPNWKVGYRLQIGSKEMFNDLSLIGFTPNKSKIVKMPVIPKGFLSHFVRGYFDGDGSVSYGFHKRNNRNGKPLQFRIVTSFASGSKEFLEQLKFVLHQFANIQGGCLSRKSTEDESFQLAFSAYDSKRIFQFIYSEASMGQFLERKYNKFQEAFQIMQI